MISWLKGFLQINVNSIYWIFLDNQINLVLTFEYSPLVAVRMTNFFDTQTVGAVIIYEMMDRVAVFGFSGSGSLKCDTKRRSFHDKLQKRPASIIFRVICSANSICCEFVKIVIYSFKHF